MESATTQPATAAHADENDPWTGETLDGRWRVLRRLGQGAMGAVYQGEHATLARPVAIKVIAENATRDASMRARFAQEAMTVARLQHPHIVSAIDVGNHHGRPFLVMELVDGEPLEHRIVRDGPIPWKRAVSLAFQMAHALGTAHKAGIVHRDVKPANILVTTTDLGEHAKVADFGIASLMDRPSALTMVGAAIGTPGYLAPEQSLGARVTAAADVYALGATLFEMLTGRPVFDLGDDVMALLRAHLTDAPPLPSAFVAAIPPALDSLVSRMLAKQPGERPIDGLAVAAEMRALLDESPLAAENSAHKAVVVARIPREQQGAEAIQVFISAVNQEAGSIANVVGAEFVAYTPGVEAALRLADRVVTNIVGASAALDLVDPRSSEVAGDVLRNVIGVARLSSQGEVLVTTRAHDSLGLGSRGRLQAIARVARAGVPATLLFRTSSAHPDPALQPTIGVSSASQVAWTCACGTPGLAEASSSDFSARCNGCSAHLLIQVGATPEPTTSTEATHVSRVVPVPQAARVPLLPETNQRRREDTALISALSRSIRKGTKK